MTPSYDLSHPPPSSSSPVTILAQVIGHRASLHRPSFVDHRGIATMPKTMKQMKAIFKKYLQERVRVQRAASAIVAAHQAVLQAQHDLVLMQAVEASGGS